MHRTTFAIPCRNGAEFLPDLLESLSAQTCSDFDLLLVDDASTDGSADVARRRFGDRIRIARNPEPLGLIPNFNRCAELVETEFFCIAHADDRYAPDYLGRMLAALDARPEAALAHCLARSLDDAGRVWDAPAERFKRRFWCQLPARDAAGQFRLLQAGNHVVCPSALFRTQAFRSIGAFRSDLRYAADWELWLRMSLMGLLFASVPEPLFSYRRHPGSATSEASRDLLRYREELQVLRWAARAGAEAGFPAAGAPLTALRNTVLQDVVDALTAGRAGEAASKLRFLRDEAPEVWRMHSVRLVRLLAATGGPGRLALRLARSIALRAAPLA
jgi:glycosyltransferase involved in cell wall biosynthesis